MQSAAAPVLNLSGENDGLEYGASVDLASGSYPRSIWGEKSSSSGGWNLKTRAELSQGMYDFNGGDTGAYVTVEGTDDDEETFFWGSAAISKGDVSPLKAGAKKVFPGDEGKFMVAPRYDFETSTAKVVLGFENDDTSAYLTVSEDDKDLLIEQKIDDSNSAKVKAGLSGLISASLTNEGDLGSTTVTLTGDEVDVEVKSDGWVAGITCDKKIVGAEPTVRFSKSLSFGL